ncbi:unnamed protein product [Heligmosomoides polygyrus]|uniref:Cytochrome b561 domain-containing protein n=1 Tax=Heligmosomoides polygyrus TaxID=6339 RepID=A0A183GPK7_HELPZ|nr:unnamed protein product [Heligmosomoides polygyrus]
MPPEGCVFAQLLNMTAFLVVLTIYIRHRQTVEFYEHRLNWKRTVWHQMSLALMYMGFASALGLTLVANFPESELPLVHMIGAVLTFFSMVIYGWGQVIMGYSMVPRMVPLFVVHLRMLLIVVATLCLVLHELAVTLHVFVASGAGAPPGGWYRVRRLGKDSPFYLNYMIATGSEWVMALTMAAFILTFVAELRYTYAHAPRVVFRRDADDNPALGEPC